MSDKKTAQLNIFLVKPEFDHQNQIIKEDECSDPVEIPISEAGKGKLYIKRKPGKYPKWSSIFKDVIEINLIGKTKNVSAAFLLKVSDRFFVLVFGSGGRFLLKDDVCEERFGLLVALNSVDRESFRCIDKQSLDSIDSHTRVQSGYETTADQFGLDVEQDMLKAIVGKPMNASLGSRMTGTDSLTVSVQTELANIPALLTAYIENFEKDLSKTDYQWVNNISAVKSNSSTVHKLDEELIVKFNNKDYSNLWLAIPQIIDWEAVKGFIFTNGKKILHPDINLEGFLSTVKDDASITLELLKSRRVYCADEEHNSIYSSWPIYKCIYAEIDHEENKYILNDAKWFKVNKSFVKKTDVDFQAIESSALSLPLYFGGGEGKYNSDTVNANPDQFVLLDDKNKIFHGGGHGQVEVCDLLSINKQLIHVKIYGKSSVFSHLFAQGFVSGQLLQLDSEFRHKVKSKLHQPFCDLINVEKRPDEREFTVIYAVISDSPGDDLQLPFFSRVNLNNTAKTLKGFGYNVEILKIHVDDSYAKTKKCPPSKSKQV